TQHRQFVGGGRRGLGHCRSEADRPAGGLAHGLVGDARMQAGNGHLLALRVRLQEREVRYEPPRAPGGHTQAAPVGPAPPAPRPWPSEATKRRRWRKLRSDWLMTMKTLPQAVAISGAPRPPGRRVFGLS